MIAKDLIHLIRIRLIIGRVPELAGVNCPVCSQRGVAAPSGMTAALHQQLLCLMRDPADARRR